VLAGGLAPRGAAGAVRPQRCRGLRAGAALRTAPQRRMRKARAPARRPPACCGRARPRARPAAGVAASRSRRERRGRGREGVASLAACGGSGRAGGAGRADRGRGPGRSRPPTPSAVRVPGDDARRPVWTRAWFGGDHLGRPVNGPYWRMARAPRGPLIQ